MSALLIVYAKHGSANKKANANSGVHFVITVTPVRNGCSADGGMKIMRIAASRARWNSVATAATGSRPWPESQDKVISRGELF
jgi:hypothetical protein